MPTGFYVPGPADIALGPTNGTMAFLGWTQRGVQVSEQLNTVPVQADYAGPAQPADIMLGGKTISLLLEIIDFDPVVAQAIFGRIQGGTLGGFAAGEIGTLTFTEGRSLTLMVKARRQPTVAAFANYLPGIRVPVGLFSESVNFPISLAPMTVVCSFFGWTVQNRITLASTAWDTIMTGFPAIT